MGALLRGSRGGRRGLGLGRRVAARLVFSAVPAVVFAVVLRETPDRALFLDAHLEHAHLTLHLHGAARHVQRQGGTVLDTYGAGRGGAGRTSVRKLAPCSIAVTSPACQPESPPCTAPEITRCTSTSVPTAGTLAARSLYRQRADERSCKGW